MRALCKHRGDKVELLAGIEFGAAGRRVSHPAQREEEGMRWRKQRSERSAGL